MKVPKINMDEMNKWKEDNFKERLEFIDKYVDWLKKTPNKKWSSEQNELIVSE